MRRLLSLLLALLLLAPVALAQEATDIYTYQKVKNVTRGDNPLGSTTTVGFVDDRVHYLIFVQNTSDETQAFTVVDRLPRELVYRSGSAKIYRGPGDGWVDLPGNDSFALANYELTLDTQEWVYLTFRTDIDWLPESNVALMNIVEVTSTTGSTASSATKILAPNTKLTKFIQPAASSGGSVAAIEDEEIAPLSDYERELLAEEFAFIEQAWTELGVEEERPPLPEAEAGRLPLLYVVISFLLFTGVFYAFQHHTFRR